MTSFSVEDQSFPFHYITAVIALKKALCTYAAATEK
jgi:hypothetical protein